MFNHKYKKPETKKASFLEKLVGAGSDDSPEFHFHEPHAAVQEHHPVAPIIEDEELEGELAVDVYETDNDIIVQTMAAGVRPEELQINITPDYITISGKRENAREVQKQNFLFKELYWGAFSRTIELPKQVDPDLADAVEKHGLLIIKLPKLDRTKEHRVKIKST